jgi:hypothetical protein
LNEDSNFDVFFFDHDLGDRIFVNSNDENTGYQVAKFMSDKNIKGRVIIHSYNPIGAKNMMNVLPQAVYIPFSKTMLIEIRKGLNGLDLKLDESEEKIL